jgi:hypothetical protein
VCSHEGLLKSYQFGSPFYKKLEKRKHRNYIEINLAYKDIVAHLLKARTVKPAETAVARELL